MFTSDGPRELSHDDKFSGNEAARQGVHDGVLAGHVAFRAGEESVSPEELQLRASLAWGLKRMMPETGGLPGTGSVQDYVRCFCAAYQSTSSDHQRRMETLSIPDIGRTLEAIREYFEMPDLELPPGADVCLHAVMHSPSREPFHLLSAAGGFVEVDELDPPRGLRDRPRPTGRYLACKALLPNSAVLPATGRVEWANEQVWLGERTRSFALTR